MQLEEELDAQLFIRGKNRIVLTDEGMLLRRRAEEIVDLAKKTEKSVDQISKDLENISPEDLEILKQKITELQNNKHETE